MTNCLEKEEEKPICQLKHVVTNKLLVLSLVMRVLLSVFEFLIQGLLLLLPSFQVLMGSPSFLALIDNWMFFHIFCKENGCNFYSMYQWTRLWQVKASQGTSHITLILSLVSFIARWWYCTVHCNQNEEERNKVNYDIKMKKQKNIIHYQLSEHYVAVTLQYPYLAFFFFFWPPPCSESFLLLAVFIKP